jgi:hypothetical protein
MKEFVLVAPKSDEVANRLKQWLRSLNAPETVEQKVMKCDLSERLKIPRGDLEFGTLVNRNRAGFTDGAIDDRQSWKNGCQGRFHVVSEYRVTIAPNGFDSVDMPHCHLPFDSLVRHASKPRNLIEVTVLIANHNLIDWQCRRRIVGRGPNEHRNRPRERLKDRRASAAGAPLNQTAIWTSSPFGSQKPSKESNLTRLREHLLAFAELIVARRAHTPKCGRTFEFTEYRGRQNVISSPSRIVE